MIVNKFIEMMLYATIQNNIGYFIGIVRTRYILVSNKSISFEETDIYSTFNRQSNISC